MEKKAVIDMFVIPSDIWLDKEEVILAIAFFLVPLFLRLII